MLLKIFATGAQCLAKYGTSTVGFLVDLQQSILQALGGGIGK